MHHLAVKRYYYRSKDYFKPKSIRLLDCIYKLSAHTNNNSTNLSLDKIIVYTYIKVLLCQKGIIKYFIMFIFKFIEIPKINPIFFLL